MTQRGGRQRENIFVVRRFIDGQQCNIARAKSLRVTLCVLNYSALSAISTICILLQSVTKISNSFAIVAANRVSVHSSSYICLKYRMLEVIFFSSFVKVHSHLLCEFTHENKRLTVNRFKKKKTRVSVLFLTSSRKHFFRELESLVDLYCELIDLSLYR